MLTGILEQYLFQYWELRYVILACYTVFVATGSDFLLRRYVLSGIFLSLGLFLTTYSISLVTWARNLGVDSFLETQGFDLNEAIFFLSTATQILEPTGVKSFLVIVFSALLLSALTLKLLITGPVRLNLAARSAHFIILCGLLLTAYDISSQFEKNSEHFRKVAENFNNRLSVQHAKNSDLKVIVYIGESTSIFNWQLYGYFRQTNPALTALRNQANNLLLFDNVLSTHTHTSPSLLEALSFPYEKYSSQSTLPIYEQKRASLISALQDAGVPVYWLSNQNKSGSWNIASTIVAGESVEKIWSINSDYAPNSNDALSRPYDDDFIKDRLQKYLAEPGPLTLVFHSYAGHGPYLKAIPEEWRAPVDTHLAEHSNKAIYGRLADQQWIRQSIEEYDSTMRYIDHNIAYIFSETNKVNTPVISVYFSDHGESVYTGQGHESSRFTHEMVRVPFMVFFNDTAINAYPDLFTQFSTQSKINEISTLAQLPITLTKLFGIEIDSWQNTIAPIGSLAPDNNQRIVVRYTANGKTYIDLNPSTINSGRINGTNVNDHATSSFAINAARKSTTPLICYQRANSIGSAIRGSITSPCLEFDLFVENNGFLSIRHPPAQPTGLHIQKLLSIAQNRNLKIWIDGKNTGNANACNTLLAHLEESGFVADKSLIEFPANSDINDFELRNCITSLRKMHYSISYYTSTRSGLSCKKDNMCEELKQHLQNVIDSGIFTDLSFDIRLLTVIQNFGFTKQLNWNTWGIDPEQLRSINLNLFDRIILNTQDDPNRI